jgi:hypothetical protein
MFKIEIETGNAAFSGADLSRAEGRYFIEED